MRGFVFKRSYKRKAGTAVLYYAVVEAPMDGAKRRQDWGKGYKTRAEAERALRERLTALDNRTYVPNNRLTFGDYLRQEWLPLMRDRIKPTTMSSYERIINGYVVPRLGKVRLQELTTAQLNRLYAELRESGGTWQSKAKRHQLRPLSQKTVRNVHAVISKALNDAIDAGLVTVNVAHRAKPPRQGAVSHTIEAWTAEELAAFLEFVREDRLFACWYLAAVTGMRRSELLGLRWRDIDFAVRTLAVRQAITLAYTTIVVSTPKSGQARVINLDNDSLRLLAAHRQRQLDEQRAFGAGYVDSGLVFRREDGNALRPDRLSQLFDKFVRHAGIRRINFHGLRHTHATLLLKAGVPVKVVSERLGHSDPAFTLRIYQHVLSGMQAAAASAFSQLVREAGLLLLPEPTLPFKTELRPE